MACALPNGLVGEFGGSRSTNKLDPYAVFNPEFYDPGRDVWEVGPPSNLVMTYHCNAAVLPWGDVAVTGSGENLGQQQPDHPFVKVYRPWYMTGTDIPTITSAPSSIQYGKTFTVVTPDAKSIDGVTLNGLGASTHSVNPNAVCRSLAFEVKADGTSLTVTAPADSSVLPRRHYFLALKRGLVTSPGKMLALA
jgi:hypothetical protein